MTEESNTTSADIDFCTYLAMTYNNKLDGMPLDQVVQLRMAFFAGGANMVRRFITTTTEDTKHFVSSVMSIEKDTNDRATLLHKAHHCLEHAKIAMAAMNRVKAEDKRRQAEKN